MNTNYQTLILKKNEILEDLKKAIYNDIEDLVDRMQLTYDEVMDKLHLIYSYKKNRLFPKSRYLRSG